MADEDIFFHAHSEKQAQSPTFTLERVPADLPTMPDCYVLSEEDSDEEPDVEKTVERFHWHPFKNVSNVVQQGHLWRTQGVLNLREGESIIGCAVLRPYWLQQTKNDVVSVSGDTLTHGKLLLTPLEPDNYRYKKSTWRSARGIFDTQSVRFSSSVDQQQNMFDVECRFALSNSQIVANSLAAHKTECPRGAFSLCVEVVIRKGLVDTLCRVWSDGFTIVEDAASGASGASGGMKAPEQDEHVIGYTRLPKLLRTVSGRNKRLLATTLDSEQTEAALSASPIPLKKLSLSLDSITVPRTRTVPRIIGWNGVLHLRGSSVMELTFSGDDPANHVVFDDYSAKWKSLTVAELSIEKTLVQKTQFLSIS